MLNLLSGSKVVKSEDPAVTNCSDPYWTIVAVRIAFPIIMSLFVLLVIRREEREKALVDYPFEKGTDYKAIEYTVFNLIFLAIAAVVCGVVMGLIGLGSGLILMPILLRMRMHQK